MPRQGVGPQQDFCFLSNMSEALPRPLKAKFEAEQKAKREKKIEERREAEKRAEERAREHAIQMERVLHRQNVEETMLALQMQAFGRYYSGISDIPSSLPLSYATSIAPGIMAGMNGFR